MLLDVRREGSVLHLRGDVYKRQVLPLCREHHTEAHTMPDADFFEKYHIPGGIVLDRTLCRLYGDVYKRQA